MKQPLLQTPTVGAQGGVIGRPRKPPPEDAAERITQAAAAGCSLVGIASRLGVAKETLGRWLEEQRDLREAFEAGRDRDREYLEGLVRRDAMDAERPNVNAIFLLKCRHGYREGDQGDGGPRVNVIVNLPGAMSRDDYLKTVTNVSGTEIHTLPAASAHRR